MKRFSVVFVLVTLLSVPAVVVAQYDYPSGGGSSGGGIQVGGGGYPSSGDQSGDGDSGGGGDVTIVDFAYQPAAIFVSPGGTVIWYNAGDTAHTVDANSGVFDSPTINPGGNYSQTFETGGVYPYHCEFHSNMRGMVVVTGI